MFRRRRRRDLNKIQTSSLSLKTRPCDFMVLDVLSEKFRDHTSPILLGGNSIVGTRKRLPREPAGRQIAEDALLGLGMCSSRDPSPSFSVSLVAIHSGDKWGLLILCGRRVNSKARFRGLCARQKLVLLRAKLFIAYMSR